MPNTYINDGGVWKAVTQPYVNQSGTNTPVKAIYVKDGGSWKIAWPTYSLQYLVIAGGGGGGNWQDSVGGGGGGGAGGLLQGTTTLTQGQVYTATVGAGGIRFSGNGGDSSLTGSGLSIPTAVGGGGGGSISENGRDGGSGGGGAAYVFGSTSGGAGTAGQGFAGAGPQNPAGGGGGGASGTPAPGGGGGPGLTSSITGSSVLYAIGGNGFYSGKAMPANSGYGGDGYVGPFGVNGQDGATGVVILRIPTVYYTGTVTGSPTVTTVGNDTVITFTGNGTYTA
jgi:hypothetical protein